jgi:hypothetical protein
MDEAGTPRRLVVADDRGRMTVPEARGRQFLAVGNPDGSITLTPAVVLTAAEAQLNNDPELLAKITTAMQTPGRRRTRTRRLSA